MTHVRPEFGPGPTNASSRSGGWTPACCSTGRTGADWPNKRTATSPSEVFAAHGLDSQVTDTAVVHDEKVSTIIQRETDLQLLRRLALRNGFECYVEGDTGHFGPPRLADPPSPCWPSSSGTHERQPVAARGRRAHPHRASS